MRSKRTARRQRLDRLLVTRGLAPSREKAQALLLAGQVRIGGRPAGKPGSLVPEDSDLTLVSSGRPFVGRGGVKLQGALETLGIDPCGRAALDVGSSTGGFTDCLLRRGARRVYALDVGTGQLDWSLRNDPRVVVMEGRNARYLKTSDLPERVTLVVADVSFISLRLILPALVPLLEREGDLLCLVKPQFEVGRLEVGRKGIVRDPRKHQAALRAVAEAAGAAGLTVQGGCESPITGAEGNREFFLHMKPGAPLDHRDLAPLLGGIVHGDEGSAGTD